MEDKMEYPEEIYKTRDGGLLDSYAGPRWGRRHAYEVGYEAGKADRSDPLAGYSNLTAAISAGEPIDWEKLEGRFAKCVHPELPTPFPIGNLQVHNESELRTPTGWREVIDSLGSVRRYVLMHSWWGDYDWSLWVEGEVPLRSKTADQLEVGTEFYGVLKNSEPDGVAPELMLRTQGHVLHLNDYTISQMSPRHFEVVKVVGKYGTFQGPEGK